MDRGRGPLAALHFLRGPLAHGGSDSWHPHCRCAKPCCDVRCAGAAWPLARTLCLRFEPRSQVYCCRHWPRAWPIWGSGCVFYLESGSGRRTCTPVCVTGSPSPTRLRLESESRAEECCATCSLYVGLSSLVANWGEGANFSLLGCHCLGRVVLAQECGLPSGV